MHTPTSIRPIVVAVDHPLLHPEALHIAAATGRPVVEARDAAALERIRHKAFALLVDATFHSTTANYQSGDNVFVVADQPDPANPHAFALPAQASELLRALGSLAQRPTAPAAAGGNVLAVVGACGGVGVSVLAASISSKARADAPTLVDGHLRSGGADLLLGIEERPGARWGEIALGEGTIARDDIRRALPATSDGVAVLTSARTTVADGTAITPADVETVVGALSTAGVTVLDVPVEAVPQRCDAAVIVVPGQLRPAAAAARIAAELEARGVPHTLVMRRTGWESLTDAEVERVTGSKVIAHLPTCSGLAKTIERGGLPRRLPRPLAAAAERCLAEVVHAPAKKRKAA